MNIIQLRRFFENSLFIDNISELIKRYISYRFEKCISFIKSFNDFRDNSNDSYRLLKTFRILTKKNISRRNLNIISSKFNIQFIDIKSIITNIIVYYIKNNLSNQESQDSSNSFKNLEINVVNESYENHFLNSDVEFFNSFYNNKFNNIEIKIKHIKKKTYFRDIFIFINRIKNVVKVKNIKFIKNNL